MKTLRVVLNHQLNQGVASLSDLDRDHDAVLLCEPREEYTHVRHHRKKILFQICALRHFADELTKDGYHVIHVPLDDPENTGTLAGEITRVSGLVKPGRVVVMEPEDLRQRLIINELKTSLPAPLEVVADNHFLATPEEFADWAQGRHELRMEYFYRHMRIKHNVLMDGKKPAGGRWNYDRENRGFPKTHPEVPQPYRYPPDDITTKARDLVASHFHDHFGDLDPFYFALTREQALEALALFIRERLPRFGDFQDVMLQGEPWLFHSHLSFYLNIGLLLPMECIRAAEDAYRQGQAPLNAAEGFIRQILGWREYVRGIYRLKMPEYKTLNFFEAKRPLPWFYWGGDTRMNCLRQCVDETRRHAYAHHIQRLMVLGNFALLAGLDPDEVNEWYHIVYADAYEWVELPNVTGMILYADGGMLASKPYAAGGAYINKMSDYCKDCPYDPALKNGEGACPFNYLYWDFLLRHEDKLSRNPRLAMAYKTLSKFDDRRKAQIRSDAQAFLQKLQDNDETVPRV